MSEEKKPAEKVEAAKPAETPKTETPKAEAPKEKKPMDPKKKKNIIIWSCVGGVALIGIIVAVVLVIVLNKVDYKESYTLAKDLDDKISDFYYDYDDCLDVVEDVNDDWAGTSTYSSRVTDCKSAISKDTIDKVNQLAGTSGVAHDGDVKAKFDKFYDEFKKATSSVNDDTAKTLDVYDSWHKFVYDSDGFSFYSATEDKINTVANYAINSGNDTFKAFGEQWKTKALEVYKAYQEYDKATTGYSSLYSEYTSKKSALTSWRDDNLPKPSEVLPLKFEGDSTTVRTNWNEFVKILTSKYGEEATKDAVNEVMNSSTYEDLIKELMK